MAVDLGRPPLQVPARRVALPQRLLGLGSIFGKTIRDSRLSIVAMAAVTGGIILVGGATMASTYGTMETRRELAALSSSLPPVLRGLYGNPVNVDTLGGFLSWHYGAYFALLAGLWSILALSSTLAEEARRGSLEFAVVTQLSRRRIALEKLAGHLAAMALAMAVVALLAWLTGATFSRFPEDAIAPDRAVGFAIGLGAKALVAGSVAFALASLVGRGAAAGLAGALMLAGYVLNSYRTVVPAFDTAANLTWFAWTRDHVPLAGPVDWPSIGLVTVVCVALCAFGVEAFARRDVGGTGSLRAPGLPGALLGTRGPLRRSFGELLPTALAWGVGLGLYGLVMAGSSRSFIDELARSPGLLEAVRNMVPGVDIATAPGFLQLAFVDIGLVLTGLAAATFVAGRSSDETDGRLELLLTTPLTRIRWAVSSGIAVWLALWLAIAVLAIAVAVGVATGGDDGTRPALGMFALAAYGTAMAGIGFGVSGVVGSRVAAPTVVVVAIGTFLVDLLAPALKLPDWVHQLALSAHLGQPMVGTWDAVGILACLGLALAGIATGAWGMRRRDVRD